MSNGGGGGGLCSQLPARGHCSEGGQYCSSLNYILQTNCNSASAYRTEQRSCVLSQSVQTEQRSCVLSQSVQTEQMYRIAVGTFLLKGVVPSQ
jgi:hypothetical protein